MYSSLTNKPILSFFIYLFALLAPLSATFLAKPLVILFAVIYSIYFSILILYYRKIKIFNIELVFIFGYSTFILISSLSLIITLYKLPISIYDTKLINRTMTSSLVIITILIICDWIQKQPLEKAIRFLKISLISTLLFAALAIYQIFSFEFNLPFIITRAYVWGATPEITKELSYRLTSIALEPSFYTPIIIESIILSYLLLRKSLFIPVLLISIFLIYKTHATSAYIHLAILTVIYLAFNHNIKYKHKLTFLLLVGIFILYMITSNNLSMEYFIDKLYIELSGQSSRSHSYGAIVTEIINLDILNLLFGNGVNTLSFFNELTNNSYKMPFSVSNNLYIDVLWDSGIIGGIVFFISLTIIFIKIYPYRKNKFGFSSLLLLFSLLITSLYRSEYTSTHFAWIIINIIICYYISKSAYANKVDNL